MNCKEFLRLLDDGADVAQGDAGDHVDACLSCRRAVERWQAVRGELRSMRSDEAPPFLHTRIMAHVGEAARLPERGPWWALRPVWAMPLVVVAIIVAAGGYGLFEVMRPRVEPVSVVGVSDKRTASAGFERKDTERDRVAEAVPASSLRGETAQAKSAPSGARFNRGAPARAAKEGAGAARRAEKQAAPLSFSKGDQISPVIPDQAPRDVLAANVPAPAAEPEQRAGGGVAIGRMAASTQKAAVAAAPPAEITCVLTPRPGGPALRVHLDEATAPPAGTEWQVTVTRGGAIAVATDEGALAPGIASGVQRALAPLRLPGGRYGLRRVLER